MMMEKATEKVKRWKVPKGYLCVQESVCKGCGFCIEFCPRDVLASAEHYNAKGYHPPEVVNPDGCTLCRFCELVCPDFAVWTQEKDEEVDHAG